MKIWWTAICLAVPVAAPAAAGTGARKPVPPSPRAAGPARSAKPPGKPAPVSKKSAAPGRPAAGGPASPGATPVNRARLAAELRLLGYAPAAEGDYVRVKAEEGAYGYTIDLAFSKSGEWLIAMAHLAPIPDLTRVPSPALLNLLHVNDGLLGSYFSYSRENAQIMLNSTLPARLCTPAALRDLLLKLRETVRLTEASWDPARW